MPQIHRTNTAIRRNGQDGRMPWVRLGLVPLAAGAAAGIGTWKASEHIRGEPLLIKKAKLQEKADFSKKANWPLDKLKSKVVRDMQSKYPDVGAEVMKKMTNELASGKEPEEVKQEAIRFLRAEKGEFVEDISKDLYSEMLKETIDVVGARKEIMNAMIAVSEANREYKEAMKDAKRDGAVAGVSTLVLCIAVAGVFELVKKSRVKKAEMEMERAREERIALRKKKKEEEQRRKENAQSSRPSPVPKSYVPPEEKPAPVQNEPKTKVRKEDPHKELREELVSVLAPALGDIAGSMSKRIIEEVGEEAAEYIIEYPEEAYSVLLENSGTLGGGDFGKVLGLIYAYNAANQKSKENSESPEVKAMWDAIGILDEVSGGMRSNELERVLSKAGFQIDSSGVKGGHRAITYNGEPVRSNDGRVVTLPNPNTSLMEHHVRQTANRCAEYLEGKIEEAEKA